MKKSFVKLVSFIFSVVCICFLTMPLEINAAGAIEQNGISQQTADISWAQKSNEASYGVYIWMPISHWEGEKLRISYSLENLGETTQPNFHFSNLKGGEKYDIIIRSYDAEGNFLEDVEGKIETLPAKGEISKTLLKWSTYYTEEEKATMTFNLYVDIVSQGSADGYEIKLYNKKGKNVKTVKVKAEESSIQRKAFYELKENFYTVKIRAYKKFKGKMYYGKWSTKNYAIRQPMCMAKPTSSGVYIRWETIKGATGYDVYMCTEKLGEYIKVASAKANKNMILVKKYNKKKFRTGKKYYYYVVAKKKVGKTVFESAMSYRFKVVIK